MRSIEGRSRKVERKEPSLSCYQCLVKAVMGQQFQRPAINKAFSLLVPKEDYGPNTRIDLINHLVELTKTPIVDT